MRLFIESRPDAGEESSWTTDQEFTTTAESLAAYRAAKAALLPGALVREHLHRHSGADQGPCLVNESVHSGGRVVEQRATLEQYFDQVARGDEDEPPPDAATIKSRKQAEAARIEALMAEDAARAAFEASR